MTVEVQISGIRSILVIPTVIRILRQIPLDLLMIFQIHLMNRKVSQQVIVLNFVHTQLTMIPLGVVRLTCESHEVSPTAVKLRQKPDRRESKKSARNSLLGSLGLGSHKEEKDDLIEDQEKVKLKQENEWLTRQNKTLNDSLKSKVNIILDKTETSIKLFHSGQRN